MQTVNMRGAGAEAPQATDEQKRVRLLVICRFCDASGSDNDFDVGGAMQCPDCGQRSYFRTEPVEVAS